MLVHLLIQNYALIRKLEIDFSNGFSVITGETGAGKSIIIGALSLILGKRADTQVLLEKNKKCIVEGTFNIKNYDLKFFFTQNQLDFDKFTTLRREINQYGKSRAFINDTPVNLNLFKELGDKLVDIHSQHKITTLNDSNFQLAVIDNYAQISNIIGKYKLEYDKFLKLQNLFINLNEREKKSKTDHDYYLFLYNELKEANLKDEEQQEIEIELEILNNSEEIKTNLYKSYLSLSDSENNVLGRIAEINSLMEQLSKYHPDIKEINNRLTGNYIELKDIVSEIERIEHQITYDPQKIEELNNRLDLIYNLQQKHRVSTIEELINIKNNLSAKLNDISSLEENIKKLKSDISIQLKVISEIAADISKKRKQAIPKIEKDLINILYQLGIPDAQIKIEQNLLKNFTKDGKDKVIFMFNANRGLEMKEISKIASGGELSRLMLSIKSLISQRNLLPTIIFDEIDMGVSGDIADKVGNILLKMGRAMQVVAITHLPQIAGKGDTHYLVFKENKDDLIKSDIKKLDSKERINEIAKMLSGEEISISSRETARELLNTKQDKR
ncbi:MAG: DNA repair protein RecN [Bacteroidales bacterium]|nr:DNA repair protein RecN [Bacteroidales bacterium]